jgi:hypothetical protein
MKLKQKFVKLPVSTSTVALLPSPEDGNRSSSLNVCFLVIQNSGRWIEVHKLNNSVRYLKWLACN